LALLQSVVVNYGRKTNKSYKEPIADLLNLVLKVTRLPSAYANIKVELNQKLKGGESIQSNISDDR
jgi:hypothetical protein